MDTADGSYRLYDYVDGILQTCTGCTDESILRDDESFYGRQRVDNTLFGHDPRSSGYRYLSASIGNYRATLCNGRTGCSERTITFCYRPSSLQSSLKDSPGKCRSGKAALATAELNYNSTKELFEKKVVSAFNLKTSENNYLTAKAQLAQAEAQELNARNNLSYTEVKSPSDGVVGMLPYRAGALVSASIPQPLTTVSDNSNMYVYFSMTENQLLAMSRQYKSMDEALENMPEVSLKLNDQSIYEQKGKIESISGVIDRKTGTVGVRAVFPNESRLLHSGASGNVLIPQAYKDCIVIPQGATVRLQDKTLVYKVVDGKAVSTLITVAEINDGREYIVLDGLKVGEEIVSEGAGLVREGTQVK